MKLQSPRNTLFGGHRGLPRAYPDNTLAGIVAAAQVADFVELDVRRSADGAMVLSHEPTFGDMIIHDHEWEELRTFDLGGGHHPALLGEVLERLTDTPLDIEIKNFPEQPGFDPHGVYALEVARCARSIDVVTSFFWPTMDIIKETLPLTRTGLLAFDVSGFDAIEAALAGGHEVVAPHFSHLIDSNLEMVERAHEAGLEVITWTVNDPDMARRFVQAGVDAMISDDPLLISRSNDEH